ncbi:hypothetical protein BDZ45DRAFT_723502 [Acephala macrosclerotiorum]|nr:hypothetical protein BDZ45DRAFT_723502 [Acephala macrosclerotiorum]
MDRQLPSLIGLGYTLDGPWDLPSPKAAPPSPAKPAEASQYRALYNFKAQDELELTFAKDEIVRIHEKKETGWWLAENQSGKQAWVPAAYLKEEIPCQIPPTAVKSSKDLEASNDTDAWKETIADLCPLCLEQVLCRKYFAIPPEHDHPCPALEIPIQEPKRLAEDRKVGRYNRWRAKNRRLVLMRRAREMEKVELLEKHGCPLAKIYAKLAKLAEKGKQSNDAFYYGYEFMRHFHLGL